MKNSGLTLLELMLTLGLATLIISGGIPVYLTIQRLYEQQLHYSELQDSGLAAVNFLRDAIQHAGLNDCVTQPYHDAAQAIRGYTKDTAPLFLRNQKLVESDLFLVSRCHAQDSKQQFVPVAYYIAPRGNDPGLALFVKSEGGQRLELVPNVQQLDVRYGIACVDRLGVCHYKVAHLVEDWAQVIAVSLTITLSLAGKTYHWSDYVALRHNL